MKVSDAAPGDILVAQGLVPRKYTKNLDKAELDICQAAGFVPGFLMPAWIDKSTSTLTPMRSPPLFYIGPVMLKKFVGGLKKHHVFLYEGEKIALMGYDFRHLEPLDSV